MIYYPIKKLTQAGITDILIVTGVEHMGDVVGLLGSGKSFNCNFTYKVQDEAGGIAQALMLAKNFSEGEPLTVILGDNIFQDSLALHVKNYQGGAHLLIKEVPDPQRFGVAEIINDTIASIQEKPSNPKSNYAVTGIYMFDQDVFRIISECKPSPRGELEISDVNATYLKNNNVTYGILNGWWSDAGTFTSLTKARRVNATHALNVTDVDKIIV